MIASSLLWRRKQHATPLSKTQPVQGYEEGLSSPRNWKVYETALRKRGELTRWFSEEAVQAWYNPANSGPGGQRIYSDLSIQTALTVRSVYRLGLRQTEGFLRSVSALLGLNIRIPDRSRLSRRSKHLGFIGASMSANRGPVHILVDSTGLRVHSGNEPRDEKNLRGWRKLHLTIDARTGELLASALSAHRASDCSQIPGLLKQIPGALALLTADSTYDSRRVYAAMKERRPRFPPKIVIPPRRNARLRVNSPILVSPRDHSVRSIRELGKRRWGKQSGYTQRGLAETAISRFKTIVGGEALEPYVRKSTDRGEDCLFDSERNDTAGDAQQLLRGVKNEHKTKSVTALRAATKSTFAIILSRFGYEFLFIK